MLKRGHDTRGVDVDMLLAKEDTNYMWPRNPFLTEQQWDDVLKHHARGVSASKIYKVLSKEITPFFKNQSAFSVALAAKNKKYKQRQKEEEAKCIERSNADKQFT